MQHKYFKKYGTRRWFLSFLYISYNVHKIKLCVASLNAHLFSWNFIGLCLKEAVNEKLNMLIAFFTQVSTIFLNCSSFTYFTFVLLTNIIKVMILFIRRITKKDCGVSPQITGEPLSCT